MTANLHDEILLAALREWPDRWRYPQTAVALAEGRDVPSSSDLARTFLTDLGSPGTPVTTCRRLVQLGEFDAAAQLLAEESLDPNDRAALTAERDQAVARRVADTRYRISLLRRRSESIGRPVKLDPIELEEQAALSFSAVAEVLAKAELEMANIEQAVKHEVWRAAKTVATDQSADTTDWLAGVRTSLEGGDLSRARELLARGPVGKAEQLHHGDPGSGLDEHGTALATALRAMEDRITEHTVLDFVAALCDLTGAVAPRYEVHNAPGGVLAKLRSRWPGLPVWLTVPGSDGLALWVAADDQPPPQHAGLPLAWIVPRAGNSSQPALHRVARITATQLLQIPLTEAGPDGRLRGLLKLICAQLDITDLLDRRGHALSTLEITEMLNLVGVPPGPDLADSIRYETGGRPQLIAELMSEVFASPEGRGEIRPETLQRVRDAWWPRAFQALMEPYRDDYAELLLLIAVAFHADQQDGFTLDDLRVDITAVAADDEVAAQLRSIPALAAAERLIRDGLFERRRWGSYALPDSGVLHLLRFGPNGSGVRRNAEDAAAAAYRHHLADTAERRAEIGALVIRMISHMVSGTMSAIRTELTILEQAQGAELLKCLNRVRRYADPGQTLDEQFQRAMRPPEPCELHPLLLAQGDDQSWRSRGIAQVDLRCPENLHVMANKWLLGQAFANLLGNARLAIEETAARFGTIRIVVTNKESRCTIEIADSGCGLTDERRREVEARNPVPSTRGRGMGLFHSRLWFESYGGSLEIPAGQSDLGGAHFRVELPLCAETPE